MIWQLIITLYSWIVRSVVTSEKQARANIQAQMFFSQQYLQDEKNYPTKTNEK